MISRRLRGFSWIRIEPPGFFDSLVFPKSFRKVDFLNYHHLRYFWAVAREGSLRRAAERLNLSQPTISAQISALEKSLGTALFERAGRGLKLTEAGTRAYEVAEEIFALGNQLPGHVRGEQTARPLRLQVGIADAVPKLVSWSLLRPALEISDGLRLVCREGEAADLLTRLAAGRLDLVFLAEPPPAILPLRTFSQAVAGSGTVFCAARKMAASLKGGFPACLHGAPMLMPAAESAWRQTLEAWFQLHKIVPVVKAEFDDAALMKMAGASGLGVLPLPELVREDACQRYGLVPVGEAAGCSVSYYVVSERRKVMAPVVRAVLEAAAKLKLKHGAETRGRRTRK